MAKTPKPRIKYIAQSEEMDAIIRDVLDSRKTQLAVDMKTWMKGHLKAFSMGVRDRNALFELPIGDGEFYSANKIDYCLFFVDNDDLELWKSHWGHLDSKPRSGFVKYLPANKRVDTHMKKMLG